MYFIGLSPGSLSTSGRFSALSGPTGVAHGKRKICKSVGEITRALGLLFRYEGRIDNGRGNEETSTGGYSDDNYDDVRGIYLADDQFVGRCLTCKPKQKCPRHPKRPQCRQFTHACRARFAPDRSAFLSGLFFFFSSTYIAFTRLSVR